MTIGRLPGPMRTSRTGLSRQAARGTGGGGAGAMSPRPPSMSGCAPLFHPTERGAGSVDKFVT